MQIREYRESDLASLRALHAAQGFDYAFPDLRNPLFLTKLVLTDDSEAANDAAGLPAQAGFSPASSPTAVTPQCAASREGATQATTDNSDAARAGNWEIEKTQRPSTILGAAFLRLTAEAYLLLDPRAGTPQQRWQWLLALHAAAERDAWHRGLEDVHAWLPPPIAARFGKRITQLGWRRDDSWTPYCKKLTPL
jgi:hypothetical protein